MQSDPCNSKPEDPGKPDSKTECQRLLTGLEMALKNSAGIDWQAYLQAYPDVARSGMPPWRHYARHGMAEGRKLARIGGEVHFVRPKIPDIPVVSVVVCNFNNASFLHNSIGSLRSQTLQNIEIVIVDDGSTDSSPEILAGMALQDRRIKLVLHRENKGTHLARISGVEHANGQFIMFLDPDDGYFPEACEAAVSAIRQGADIVQFNTKVINHGVSSQAMARITDVMNGLPPGVYTPEDILDRQFIQRKFTHNMVNKIFRTCIIKSAFAGMERAYFTAGEDMYEFMVTLLHSSRIEKIDTFGYIYNYGTGITSSSFENICYKKIPRHSCYYPLLKEQFQKYGYDSYNLHLKEVLFNWSAGQLNSIPRVHIAEFIQDMATHYGKMWLISRFYRLWGQTPEKLYPLLSQFKTPRSLARQPALAIILPGVHAPGGAEYISRLLDALTRLGIKVYALASENAPLWPLTEEAPRVIGMAASRFPEQFRILAEIYEELGITMVLDLRPASSDAIWLMLAHRIVTIPFIVQSPAIFGTRQDKGKYARNLRSYLRCCDKALAVSIEDETLLRTMEIDAEHAPGFYDAISGKKGNDRDIESHIENDAIALARIVAEYGRSSPLREAGEDIFKKIIRDLTAVY